MTQTQGNIQAVSSSQLNPSPASYVGGGASMANPFAQLAIAPIELFLTALADQGVREHIIRICQQIQTVGAMPTNSSNGHVVTPNVDAGRFLKTNDWKGYLRQVTAGGGPTFTGPKAALDILSVAGFSGEGVNVANLASWLGRQRDTKTMVIDKDTGMYRSSAQQH